MTDAKEIRRRFYAALDSGMSTEDATALANMLPQEARSFSQEVAPTEEFAPETGVQTSEQFSVSAHEFDPPTQNTWEPRAEQAASPIPDDWRDLKWPQKRSLAASVSKHPIRNSADADAAIEAELARRA
jgi:hypothetical protein